MRRELFIFINEGKNERFPLTNWCLWGWDAIEWVAARLFARFKTGKIHSHLVTRVLHVTLTTFVNHMSQRDVSFINSDMNWWGMKLDEGDERFKDSFLEIISWVTWNSFAVSVHQLYLWSPTVPMQKFYDFVLLYDFQRISVYRPRVQIKFNSQGIGDSKTFLMRKNCQKCQIN